MLFRTATRQYVISGGYSEYNDREGVKYRGPADGEALDDIRKNKIINMDILSNGQDGTVDDAGIYTDMRGVPIIGCTVESNQTTPTQGEAVLVDTNAEDTIIRGLDVGDNPKGQVVDNGARTIIDG